MGHFPAGAMRCQAVARLLQAARQHIMATQRLLGGKAERQACDSFPGGVPLRGVSDMPLASDVSGGMASDQILG